MFLNEFTLEKLEKYEIDILKIMLKVKTMKDFMIVVREEVDDNVVFFYVERKENGEIIKCDVRDILKQEVIMHIKRISKKVRMCIIASLLIFTSAFSVLIGYQCQQKKVKDLQNELEMKKDMDNKN